VSAVLEAEARLVNEIGLPLRVDVRRPEREARAPVVIILPGFKGFKDWGMFPPTGRLLAERGLASVCVNTSRNGVRSADQFDDLEGFARNTPGRERGDVEIVIEAVRAGELGAELDGSRIAILGHSRGGGVALLVAARDPSVRAVVTWASIATFYRYTERAWSEWRSKGRLDVPNQRTGQMLWLDREVLEDLDGRREEYDLERAARCIRVPCLFVHGEQDEAVDVEDARRLFAWCGAREKEILLVPGTGHTFGAVHPWAGPSAAWELVIDATAAWLRRALS
jgi:dienelactone hydrolase